MAQQTLIKRADSTDVVNFGTVKTEEGGVTTMIGIAKGEISRPSSFIHFHLTMGKNSKNQSNYDYDIMMPRCVFDSTSKCCSSVNGTLFLSGDTAVFPQIVGYSSVILYRYTDLGIEFKTIVGEGVDFDEKLKVSMMRLRTEDLILQLKEKC